MDWLTDPELVDALETIHYHHVPLDDPRLAAAAANVGRVEQSVGSWTNPTLPHPTAGLAPASEMAALDALLEQVAYRLVLVDDPDPRHATSMRWAPACVPGPQRSRRRDARKASSTMESEIWRPRRPSGGPSTTFFARSGP